MEPQVSTVEAVIARIATRQHGIVTWDEMRESGISPAQIKRRVRKGMLIREYRGVYRVGHRAPSSEATYIAAVKACGRDAVLCGTAAGYLLRILKSPTPPPPEVMTRYQRRVPGLSTRRSRIHRGHVTDVKGIPVTTVPRTIVDLAAVLDEATLARVCHEAGVLYRTTPRQVGAVLKRRPRTPGAPKLRLILRGETRVALSVLEAGFLEFVEAHDLPLPETNRRAGAKRVDCRWPEHRLTVELDSFRYHTSRHSWEGGYARERQARARGDEFRRFTYDDVFGDQTYMLAELRTLLTAGSPRAGTSARARARRAARSPSAP